MIRSSTYISNISFRKHNRNKKKPVICENRALNNMSIKLLANCDDAEFRTGHRNQLSK